ncbi:RNA-directed DNA polymerase, eukaryota, reverse transcriptase zinc-binding domain protein [Tanacetum coccineum]
MIFKVDFKKAFDTLNWNFLDDIVHKMGFDHIWRKWIKVCINYSYTSVLVNGSPTKEFKLGKGVRKGDPLSPFIFLIMAEALSVAIEEATKGGGRLTLVKSVMGSLPLYYFSIFRAPSKILSLLESIRGRFFWGGSAEDQKISWVVWKQIMNDLPWAALGLVVSCLAILFFSRSGGGGSSTIDMKDNVDGNHKALESDIKLFAYL